MKKIKDLKETTSDGKVTISLNIPKNVLEQIELDRRLSNYTRSSWFTIAAMERLKNREVNN